VLPAKLRAHMFRKGEVHNPAGRGGEYRRCLMLCRQTSYRAAEEIIRLSRESEDERIRYMAATWIFAHAWGKPKDYDPTEEEVQKRDEFNPRDYSSEELDFIETALRLIVKRQAEKQSSISLLVQS